MALKHINIVHNPDVFAQRLRYTISFINNHPLKPQNVIFTLNDAKDADIVVYYGYKGDNERFMPRQNLFFCREIAQNSKLEVNEYSYKGTSVFSVEENKFEKNAFFTNLEFGFDVFETIFFHISRYEEYHCCELDIDEHLRMKMESQLMYKNNLHQTPVVDNLLITFFKSLGLNIADKKTTYAMTHDIDIIMKYGRIIRIIKSIGRGIIERYPISDMRSIFKTILRSISNKNEDPYNTFNWLFIDDDFFQNKTVFFVSGGKTRFDLHSPFYDKELPRVIEIAKKKSYKIGFHPSYNAYNNLEMYSQESNKLQRFVSDKIGAVRSHFLRLNLEDTFEIIEKLGFESDSSLGFANTVGFRCGTGFDYKPYNFKEERSWNFLERPLVFMDSGLFLQECKSDINCYKKGLIDFINSNMYNTHITFNFHNTTFDSSIASKRAFKDIYQKMVKQLPSGNLLKV